MDFGSNKITKFEYSKILAASLCYLMIKQQDAVGLNLFDTTIKASILPKSKTSHLNLILKTLQNSKIGKKTNIAKVLHTLAESIKKRGLVILISDLIDKQDDIIKGLRHFRHKGHEVIVFHVLDNNELNLNYNQSIQFEDLENKEIIKTDPRHIKTEYKKSISKFCEKYKIECEKNKIDYVSVNTSDLIDKSLLEYLIKRNKLS